MIRFPFSLRPLAQVEPWAEGPPTWFTLTEGHYGIDVGGEALLTSGRVDYYVARLWEDLSEFLPAVLEPVPDTLVELLTREPPGGWLSVDVPEETESDALTAALCCDSRSLDDP